MTDWWMDRPSSARDPVRRGFVIWQVAIAGSSELAFDAADWRDAIVVVERGCLELECLGGNRSSFATGAVLCLGPLSLRMLRNHGTEQVLLIAVSRVRPSHRISPGNARSESILFNRPRPQGHVHGGPTCCYTKRML
jgi:hypothetical protein